MGRHLRKKSFRGTLPRAARARSGGTMPSPALLEIASNLFVDFQRFLYAFSVVKAFKSTSSERNPDVSAKEPSSCPIAEAQTARRRRALPPLARAHAPQGPTDCTRGARGSPRPLQAREEAPRWKPRRKSGFVNDPRNDGPGPALGAGVSRPRDVREGVVQGRGVPRRAVAPPRAAVPVHSPAARRRAAHRQRGSVRGASRANTRLFEAKSVFFFFTLQKRARKKVPTRRRTAADRPHD